MLLCRFCQTTFKFLRKYEAHLYYHRNAQGVKFFCLRNNCHVILNSYSAFRSHIFRSHSTLKNEKNDLFFHCSIEKCLYRDINWKEFLKHLYRHIRNETAIKCPLFKVCNVDRMFNNVNNFKNHVLRKHFEYSNSEVNVGTVSSKRSNEFLNKFYEEDVEDEELSTEIENENLEELSLKLISSLYLSLESKYFLSI